MITTLRSCFFSLVQSKVEHAGKLKIDEWGSTYSWRHHLTFPFLSFCCWKVVSLVTIKTELYINVNKNLFSPLFLIWKNKFLYVFRASPCEAELQELVRQIDIMVNRKQVEWERKMRALEAQMDIQDQELASAQSKLDQKGQEVFKNITFYKESIYSCSFLLACFEFSIRPFVLSCKNTKHPLKVTNYP